MKKIYTIAFAFLTIASCSNNDYTIRGTVSNNHLDGKTIYKVSSVKEYGQTPAMDSTVITDGKYSFKGAVENPDYCTVYVTDGNMSTQPLLYAVVALEKGTINITTNENGETAVSGTPFNNSYQLHNDEYSNLSKVFKDTYSKIENAKSNGTELSLEIMDSLNNVISDCRHKFISVKYDYVKENINNPATWYMDLHNAAYSEATLEGKKDLLKGANEYTKTTPSYKRVAEIISILEKTSVGKPFTDFTMDDKDGRKVSLSDYVGKGKYILLDFWASWCAPCRAEMPNVIDVYNKYGRDIFEVIGISLDSDKDAWINAINQLKLPWPQLSDLKGWESVGSKKYGITGVPATILFDKDGIIIARNLRGEELQTKLEEILK